MSLEKYILEAYSKMNEAEKKPTQKKEKISKDDARLEAIDKEIASLNKDMESMKGMQGDKYTARREKIDAALEKLRDEKDEIREKKKSGESDEESDEAKLEKLREEAEQEEESYTNLIEDIDKTIKAQKEVTNKLVGSSIGKANVFCWMYIMEGRNKYKIEFLEELTGILKNPEIIEELKQRIKTTTEKYDEIRKKNEEAQSTGEEAAQEYEADELEKAKNAKGGDDETSDDTIPKKGEGEGEGKKDDEESLTKAAELDFGKDDEEEEKPTPEKTKERLKAEREKREAEKAKEEEAAKKAGEEGEEKIKKTKSDIEAIKGAKQGKLLDNLLDERKRFFNNLATRKPSQNRFLKGWLARVDSIDNYLETEIV